MKLDRILWVILSLAIVIMAYGYYTLSDSQVHENSFELIGDTGSIEEGIVDYNDIVLSNETTSDSNVITYTNNNSYSLNLSADNISVWCTGIGDNKEYDENLANNGLKVNALFAREKNGQKASTLEVSSGNTAYIYITLEYVFDEYPQNDVECQFGLDLNIAG